jgi:drug/metabolite transporter (DMT)-like permease
MVLNGFFSTLAMPFLFYLANYSGFETSEFPPLTTFLTLIATGIIANAMGDFFIAKATLLLTPLLLAVGLSLLVPLSWLVDFTLYGKEFTWEFAVGSVLCISGFVLIARIQERENKDERMVSRVDHSVNKSIDLDESLMNLTVE